MKQAMILAGGKGTRLMPLTAETPKPMLPVNGKPLIQYTIEYLRSYGYSRIVVNVAYMKHKLIDFLKEIDNGDIVILEEEDPSGSGGAILKAKKYLSEENFLIINGDIITTFDLNSLETHHQGIATLALVEMAEVREFGVVVLNNSKEIIQFQEKPLPGTELSHLINAGIYMFNKEIFQYINSKQEITDLAHDVFPSLLGNQLLYGHICKCYWKDIGKVEDYYEVNAL